MNNEYRQQGDVLIFTIDKLPKGLVIEENNTVVQHGEATGHAHRFQQGTAEILQHPETKERYLKVVKPMALTHEEHAKVEVPPGLYKIGIVQEYDHFKEEARKVRD
jgi:hypothetical protein